MPGFSSIIRLILILRSTFVSMYDPTSQYGSTYQYIEFSGRSFHRNLLKENRYRISKMKQKLKIEELKQIIPAINFHLLQACNMRCGHCFAASLHTRHLPLDEAGEIVRLLSQEGFKKINFAGGEPMLYPELDSLIREAKESGMTTSIITNGTKITDIWLDAMSGYLDWVALSIDSANSEHAQSVRACHGNPSTDDG